jgi:hypothetical protein
MSSIYGRADSLVGITLELRTMGPVAVTIGTNICGVVGESIKGPIGVAVGMTDASYAAELYGAGDLANGCYVAFGQGVPTVYAVRVGGSGATAATVVVNDGQTSPEKVGDLTAKSEGIWGNAILYTFEAGDLNATHVERFQGDGEDSYALDVAGIVEDAANSIKVGSTTKTIVYAPTTGGTGKVVVNKTAGTLTWYTGEEPTTTDLVVATVKYATIKLTLKDDNGRVEIYNNIRSLLDLQANLENSSLICTFTPVVNKTHLPTTKVETALTGGAAGSAITTTDWRSALDALGDEITPTTVAICSFEVAAGTYDLIPEFEAWLNTMAANFKPCLGFTPTKKLETKEKLENFTAGYNNRLLTIVGNSWDCSAVNYNLAVARAAREAAMPLGESCAAPENSIGGINGILKVFTDAEVDHLTRSGVDILIEKSAVGATRGVRPYIGISTSTVWQFMRCVDNRTINYIILAVKYITDQYYHRRRTRRVLGSLKASLVAVLEDQLELENIEGYTVTVTAPATNTHLVQIKIQLQNIGHIERFAVVMEVGIFNDYTGFTV